jgi:hypothetical protein
MCVTCESCNNTWFICPVHNRRWNTRNQYAASQHFNDSSIIHPSFHQIDNTNNPITNEDSIDDINDSFSASLHNTDSIENQQITDTNVFSSMSPNSQKYFSLMKQEMDKIPAQYLVHSSFSENTVFSSQYCNLFETEFHLQATRLCLSMSHSQHIQLVSLLHMLESCIDYSSNNTKFVTTRVPTSMSEVNTFYLTKSTSIRKSLPYPKAQEIHNHAFISLKDVLQHMFAYGTKMEGLYPYDNNDYIGTYVGQSNKIFNTPFMKQKINEILKQFPSSGNLKPLVLFGTVWSDGFDANNVVHSAPSIWMRTITISPPQDNKTSTLHTFVLHMSHEGVDHDEINKMFNRELQELELGHWFYSSLLQKKIFVILKIHVYTADRPERGKLTSILGHTGICTKRWMYSAYLPKPTERSLQTCDACFESRIRKAKINSKFSSMSIRRCGHCADWDFDHHNMKVLKPEGYPTSYNIDGPNPHKERRLCGVSHLPPMILSFDNLKKSAQFLFYNVYKKGFNIGESNIYGKSVGMSVECIKDIIDQAKSLYRTNPNLSNDEIISKLKYPPMWDCPIHLKQFIDAPMHLIFQGVVKSLIEMISDWLTGLSYHKRFCQIIHPLMIKISNMNLKWCFLNSFNEAKNYKTTGWIANNYLAFARLMLIFYRYIRSVVPTTEPGLLQCEGMIQSGLCLFSYIMSQHNNDPNPIQEYTKLFLSCVDKFEETVYVPNGAIPIWKTRGNFLSLLNLPLQQEYFGNVRHFWEGERERFIQSVKPLLTKLRHSTSFLVTKLERLYQFAAIDYMLESIPDRVISGKLDKSYDRTNDFMIYKNLETVNQLLLNKAPVSGIQISCDTDARLDVPNYYVVINHTNNCLKCVRFQFKEEQKGRIKCAHYYNEIDKFDLQTRYSKVYNSKASLNKEIIHFILLIPDLVESDVLKYTIISNEWTYLNRDMKLDFCSIQNNLFIEL